VPRPKALAGLCVAVLALLAAPTAAEAKVSAKGTCAKLTTAGAGKALGLGVKREVRDGLVIPTGDRTLGFECGFYPSQPSEKFPRGESVASVFVSRSKGNAAKLKKLLKSDTREAGWTVTKLKGVGSAAYVAVQPIGLADEYPPHVEVFVLKGRRIFYTYSQETDQAASEALARYAAGKL
jgi:hypothetical protein